MRVRVSFRFIRLVKKQTRVERTVRSHLVVAFLFFSSK